MVEWNGDPAKAPAMEAIAMIRIVKSGESNKEEKVIFLLKRGKEKSCSARVISKNHPFVTASFVLFFILLFRRARPGVF